MTDTKSKSAPPDATTVFDVVSTITGAQVVIGLESRQQAREEARRLNAEAKAISQQTGKPTGLERGRVTRYDVQDRTIVVDVEEEAR